MPIGRGAEHCHSEESITLNIEQGTASSWIPGHFHFNASATSRRKAKKLEFKFEVSEPEIIVN